MRAELCNLLRARAPALPTIHTQSHAVDELKEELEVGDEVKTGNKAWLRRRLHAAIVRCASPTLLPRDFAKL